ncbi:uncharacterized protein LOC123316610 [Coccinella septempunctata]|uniref:uncharacterized protein LOC123316610 n=1 Tax=Coccinella septempunctata TaxID=41139 RepID=UPI001D08447F|nr:uncharacterized protein LOC123316610 [Coccinella septempunctata]
MFFYSLLNFFQYNIIAFSYITQMKTIKYMEDYQKEHFRSFSSAGEEVNKSIVKKMRLGKYLSLGQMLFTVLSLISLLPIKSDRSGILYIIMMIKRARVPYIVELFHSLHFYVVHFFAFQVVYCYNNVMLYFVLHLHFQYLLLIEDCKRLEYGLDTYGYTNKYHRTIESRLNAVLSHYQTVSRFQILIDDLFRRPMFFVVWVGLVALMFVSYLLVEVDLGSDILLVFMVWISIIEIALHFVAYGQLYADQRNNLWDTLLDFQWINWNSRNRRTYQMFLKHVNQETVIKPGGLINLDLTFLIWFGRKTVSAVAFLSTIEEINSSN